MKLKCWKGYLRKVLVFNGVGRKCFVLCFVVVVYYFDVKFCCCYEFFRNVFKDLDGYWEVVDFLEVL